MTTDNDNWPYPWLAQRWQDLSAALREDRLGAAILITGPAGVGRHALAEHLLGHAVCQAVAEGAETACGKCVECVQHAAGSHPDLMRLQPPEGKAQIAVDQLREVLSALTLTRHYGRRRLVLITPAEGLNESGVNALLKSIEEPPPQTGFVLIAERPQELRATIRSRCQMFRVPLPAAAVARQWLQGQGIAADAADQALLAAGGAPLLALDLAGDEQVQRIGLWRQALEAVETRRKLPQAVADAVADAGESEAFLRWLQRQLQQRAQAAAFGAEADSERLAVAARASESVIAHRRMLKGNVNQKMVIESMLVTLARGR